MTNDITTRLEILHQASMIDDNELANLYKMIELLETRFQIRVVGAVGSMFVSHMAMILVRLRTGDDIAPMNPEMLKQLSKEPGYSRTPEIIEAIYKECGIAVSENESGYVSMHLCTLIMNRGEE
ncbi:MAG: PRD domain-containing protein [Angelakisella sp.]